MPSIVLLAGSDRMLQQMAGTFDAGQIHTASTNDGYEAVCLLNETIPDLLIAEISLPQKDGYALCRYVRQEPEFQSLPVILLDREFNIFNQHRAFTVGADLYLSQPLSPDELIEAVSGLLATKDAPDDDVTGDRDALATPATTRPPLVAKAAGAPVDAALDDKGAQPPPAHGRFDEHAVPPPLATHRPNHLLFGAVALAAILIAISLTTLMRRATPGQQAATTDKASGALATTGQPVVTAPEPEPRMAVITGAASPFDVTSSPDISRPDRASATNPINADAGPAADADTVAHANAPGDAQTVEDRQDGTKSADTTDTRAAAPAVGERRPSSPAARAYTIRPATRANHWRRGGQEMVASGEHFGSGAKHFGKGSARAALWAGRKAGGGVKRIGLAIKRLF